MAIGHGASCWFLGVAARAHVPVSDEPTAGSRYGWEKQWPCFAFIRPSSPTFLPESSCRS